MIRLILRRQQPGEMEDGSEDEKIF